MRTLHHHYYIASIILLILLLLYPHSAPAAFKCMVDSQVAFTDRACGPRVKLQGQSANTYSGKLRPGEWNLLRNINRLPSTAAGTRSEKRLC